MKTFFYFAIVLSLCFINLTLSGCHGKVERDGKTVTLDVTEEAVRENIDDLAKSAWNKSNYQEILNRQIPELDNEDTRESITKKLNDAYGKVLVREGNKLMDSNGCGPNHTRLNSVMAELKRDPFKKAEGAATLISRYATHSDAINYAKNISTAAKATSWQSSYDSSYENQVRAQAKSHIAKNPKCNYIKNVLSEITLKQKFAQRRRNFCKSLVDQFKSSNDGTDYQCAKQLVSKITGIMGSCPFESRIMQGTKKPDLVL